MKGKNNGQEERKHKEDYRFPTYDILGLIGALWPCKVASHSPTETCLLLPMIWWYRFRLECQGLHYAKDSGVVISDMYAAPSVPLEILKVGHSEHSALCNTTGFTDRGCDILQVCISFTFRIINIQLKIPNDVLALKWQRIHARPFWFKDDILTKW